MNRLWFRLAVSFVLVTWLVIAFVAGLMSYAVESNFGNFLNTSNSLRFGPNFVAEVELYYVENGTWDGVETVIPAQAKGGEGNRQGANNGQGAQIFIVNTDGVIVFATNSDWIGSSMDDIGASRTVNLTGDGQWIGILGEQTPGTIALNLSEEKFLQDTATGLLLTALVGSVLAFVIGLLISLSLTRPLRNLATKVNQMKPGDVGQSIYVDGSIEIAQLGMAFNDLSTRLGDEKQQRQRMTADIAHELRTPVTVMRGHVEAMMDGVYPLDVAHLAVAYDQILHLTRLIEDMRLLTKAEAGQLPLDKTMIEPHELIMRAVQRFQPLAEDAQVTFETDIASDMPVIKIDVNRIQQALDNLLANAIRHTNPDGKIFLSGSVDNKGDLVLRIRNTGEPIPANVINHVFDRFWRADDARERDAGGTGLGLAITRLLIELHDGRIHALPTPDGATFEILLPFNTDDDEPHQSS